MSKTKKSGYLGNFSEKDILLKFYKGAIFGHYMVANSELPFEEIVLSNDIKWETVDDLYKHKFVKYENEILDELSLNNSNKRIEEGAAIPVLTYYLYVLGVLGLISGIVGCIIFFPVKSNAQIAYHLSVIYLTAGIIQSSIFFALGSIFRYIKGMHLSLKKS